MANVRNLGTAKKLPRRLRQISGVFSGLALRKPSLGQGDPGYRSHGFRRPNRVKAFSIWFATILALVEQEIAARKQRGHRTVCQISSYLTEGGGKRLRPALLLLAAGAAGYRGKSAIRLGAVVEMLHSATLIHDDVIDAADTRRGRPERECPLGQSHERSRRRLALHAVVRNGAARTQFHDSRYSDRPDSKHGRRRTAAIDAPRPD